MELLKSNYAAPVADAEPTEASLQLDTDALPAPSLDSQAAPTISALAQQDLAPRRFAHGVDGMLYVHKSSLLGWHRVLGHPVRACLRTRTPVLRSCCWSHSAVLCSASH